MFGAAQSIDPPQQRASPGSPKAPIRVVFGREAFEASLRDRPRRVEPVVTTEEAAQQAAHAWLPSDLTDTQ
jgi:hypothetical protein